MTILVAGASGATGKLLVEQLVNLGHNVKVIVRPSSNIPESWKSNSSIAIFKFNIADIGVNDMLKIIKDCDAAALCLGHNLTLKGIFGKPGKLVTQSVRLICDSVLKNSPDKPFKFVLMNTAGNSNRDLDETVSFGEKIIIGLIRLLLPPHTDNENAADYLRLKIGKNNPVIEWVVVRPDNLINTKNVTGYSLHKSPLRSAIFNPGKTSRINVGDFMARLISDENLWNKWKGQMPVIYNDTK